MPQLGVEMIMTSRQEISRVRSRGRLAEYAVVGDENGGWRVISRVRSRGR